MIETDCSCPVCDGGPTVRDGLRFALDAVFGANDRDTDAVLDKLDDAGLKVVRK